MVEKLIRVTVGDAADIVRERDGLIAGMLMVAKNAGRIAIDCHRTFPPSKRSALTLI
jgi:hypothetical protein